MNAYTLKVGCTYLEVHQIDDLNFDIINRLAVSYGGLYRSNKLKAFKIPCCADCGDTTCTSNIECNLIEFEFFSEEVKIPNNLERCFAAMTMFEPIVGVQVLNQNYPTDMNIWNRFDQDATEIEGEMETKKKDLN